MEFSCEIQKWHCASELMKLKMGMRSIPIISEGIDWNPENDDATEALVLAAYQYLILVRYITSLNVIYDINFMYICFLDEISEQ